MKKNKGIIKNADNFANIHAIPNNTMHSPRYIGLRDNPYGPKHRIFCKFLLVNTELPKEIDVRIDQIAIINAKITHRIPMNFIRNVAGKSMSG
jgi:hypothetical protein